MRHPIPRGGMIGWGMGEGARSEGGGERMVGARGGLRKRVGQGGLGGSGVERCGWA